MSLTISSLLAPPSFNPIEPIRVDDVSGDRLTPSETLHPPLDGTSPIQKVIDDPLMCVMRYLPLPDRLNAMLVSKQFCRVARGDIVWQKQLVQHRIWGPCREWGFAKVRQGHMLPVVANAYEQLRQYYALRKLPERQFPELFDYIARLNRGGPVAFHNLKQLDLSKICIPTDLERPIEGVRPEHMSDSVMKGVDELNRNFLAFCIADRSGGDAFVLVFVENGRAPDSSWLHNDTPMWRENVLKTDESHCRNFLVHLLKGEPYQDVRPAGVSDGLDLVLVNKSM